MYANRPVKVMESSADNGIERCFKINKYLEMFSILLPAVALEHYPSEKAKQALVGIKRKN